MPRGKPGRASFYFLHRVLLRRQSAGANLIWKIWLSKEIGREALLAAGLMHGMPDSMRKSEGGAVGWQLLLPCQLHVVALQQTHRYIVVIAEDSPIGASVRRILVPYQEHARQKYNESGLFTCEPQQSLDRWLKNVVDL